MLNVVGFLAVELCFLIAAHHYGGPAWVVIGMLAFCGQAAAGVRLESVAIMGPALGWLAWSRLTGNRELFFPYSIHLASHVAVALSSVREPVGRSWPWLTGIPPSLPSAVGGGFVVAAFLAVRVIQRAGPRVLAVESVVAAAILAIVVAAASWLRRPSIARRAVSRMLPWAIVFGASFLAYAALAL